MSHPVSTCALCPRLCRPVCPVAVGSGREAAVPTAIASVLWDHARGRVSDALAASAASLCVDCGACRSFCQLDAPFPDHLRGARVALAGALPHAVPSPEPLRALEGSGVTCVIETDGRPFGDALSQRLQRSVRRWRTGDALGVAAIDGMDLKGPHAAQIRAQASGLALVVAHGGVAKVLSRLGVPFTWLHELVPSISGVASCCAPGAAAPLGCCGGAGPLVVQHPADARRVAQAWAARAEPGVRVVDARCQAHLAAAGHAVPDAIDSLIADLA